MSYRSITGASYENLDFKLISRSVTYYVSGEEICPTTLRKHWQYFVQFSSSVALNTIKRFNKQLHFEAAINDKSSNLYCQKGSQSKLEWETHKEKGPNYGKDAIINTWGTYRDKFQGERVDLNAIRDLIMAGKTNPNMVCEENPMMYHKYGRTIEKLHDIYLSKQFRTWETTCDWYFGPTGVGKSHIAFENFDPATMYKVPLHDNGWWDNYCGQKTVIINEFRGNIQFGYLLTLIDKWPEEVKRRGRSPCPFLAEKILITSPTHPMEMYQNMPNKEGSQEQLLDRIVIHHLDGPSRRKRKNEEELVLPPPSTSAVNIGTPDIEICASPVYQRKLNII